MSPTLLHGSSLLLFFGLLLLCSALLLALLGHGRSLVVVVIKVVNDTGSGHDDGDTGNGVYNSLVLGDPVGDAIPDRC